MADTMLMMARQACNDLQRKGRSDLGQSRMATARPGARPAAPQVGVAAVSALRLRRPGKSAVNSMAVAAAPIELPRPPQLPDTDGSDGHRPLLIENCQPVAPPPQQQQRPPVALARNELAELTQAQLSLSPSQHQLMEQLHCQQQLPQFQPQLPLMSQPVAQSLATGGCAAAAAPGVAGRRVGGANVQLCWQLALYLARSASSLAAIDVQRPPPPPSVTVKRFQFDTPSPDERVLSAMASGRHQSLQHLTTNSSSSTRTLAASGPLL